MPTLPLLEPGEPVTREALEKIAEAIASDGCSGVPDFYREACLIHDLAYKLRMDPWGRPVRSKKQADANFRRDIQARSRWGRFSPMAWWRWYGVRRLAQGAWQGHRRRERLYRRVYGLPPYQKAS